MERNSWTHHKGIRHRPDGRRGQSPETHHHGRIKSHSSAARFVVFVTLLLAGWWKGRWLKGRWFVGSDD